MKYSPVLERLNLSQKVTIINNQIDPGNLSNEEMIVFLKKENNELKEYLRKILRLFSTFKSKTSIPIKSENIKLPNNTK